MADLDSFFKPKSIAIISDEIQPIKRQVDILNNVKSSFFGKIFSINPNINEISGFTTYPSISAIDDQIELAVIDVSKENAISIVQECIKKKVKAVILIPNVFEGEKDKKALDSFKKMIKGKIRVIGSNSIGVFSKELNTFSIQKEKIKYPKEGIISILSQDNKIGVALLDIAGQEEIGISKFVSIGDGSDINEIEWLEYLNKDVSTRCILMFIKNLSDGKAFIEKASKIVKNKPIVILKSKKENKDSKDSKRSIESIESSKIYSMAFKQVGIIEASIFEDMLSFAKILASQPLLKGNKIAVVNNFEGFGDLVTSSLKEEGFSLAELSNETIKKLKPVVGEVSNPLNTECEAEKYDDILSLVLKDKAVDCGIFSFFLQARELSDNIIKSVREIKMFGKPFIVCVSGGKYSLELARKLEEFGVPVYSDPAKAVRALKVLKEYTDIVGKKN